MKIIHTGDWHMNHRLGRIDMTALVQNAIVQVSDYLAQRKADVLIVAGDMFCGREGREQLCRSFDFLKKTFTPFLQRGGTIIAISGNHDSEAFYATLRDVSDMMTPVSVEDGTHATGRFYVAPNPRVLKLRDPDRQVVQFALMPYPTPRCFLLPNDAARYASIEERNKDMATRYRQYRDQLDKKLDIGLPTVLVTHARLGSVPDEDLFQGGEERDVILDAADVPVHWAYGAYGHIHRPGPVMEGATRFLYSGSLLPLDAGEAGQNKGVWFLDVGPKGLREGPEKLSITGPSLLDLTIEAGDINTLRERYTDSCDTALLRYRLRYDPDAQPDPYPLHQQIREVFPNWYEGAAEPVRATRQDEVVDAETAPTPQSLDDVAGSTLGYLRDIVSWDDNEAAKDEVLVLAERLLADDAFMGEVTGGRA